MELYMELMELYKGTHGTLQGNLWNSTREFMKLYMELMRLMELNEGTHAVLQGTQ